MNHDARTVLAIFLVILSGIGSALAFKSFLNCSVSPDITAHDSVIILALLLGAFGLISLSVKVDL
jgi:hypothetical protein